MIVVYDIGFSSLLFRINVFIFLVNWLIIKVVVVSGSAEPKGDSAESPLFICS